MSQASFEWDPAKDLANLAKHGVSFATAQLAFADTHRVHRRGSLAQRVRETLLLFWVGWRRGSDGSIHLSRRNYSHHRRRLLAQGKAYL